MADQIKVGIVGCGNISGIYFKNLTRAWSWIRLHRCSDLVEERLREKAEKYPEVCCCPTEEILADDSVDIVCNLTTPQFHTKVNLEAIEAGKHVYCEKPFALDREDAKRTLAAAKKAGVLVGCAPDTFLGASHQLCRKIIEDGIIGEVTSAMAFMTCHGHESWHPDPEFYYKQGGGPMLDMGPYYLTALVNCIGPIKKVTGFVSRAYQQRIITSKQKYGATIDVDVPTHYAGSMEFANGAMGTIVMSFDVYKSMLPRIEIHGTKGSLQVPDPNGFGREVKLFHHGDEDWQSIPLYTHSYAQNSRGLGIADMARAILDGRPHRATGALGAHVLDAMLAFEESSKQGKAIALTAPCEQPAPLPAGLAEGEGF
jgi:predicted dehydrogenase